MILVLLAALALLAFALTLALRALGGTRLLQEQERVGRIAAYGYGPAHTAPKQAASLRSYLDALANAIGGFVDRRLDNRREQELRRELYAAGLYRTTPRRFLGYRLLITVALVGFWLWLMLVSGGSAAGVALGTVCLGAIGWVGPKFFIKRRAAERLQRVDHEIPELVDLLVTAIEGGMGFAGALQLVSKSLQGPLGEEIRIVLSEQNIGLTTNEALRNMASPHRHAEHALVHPGSEPGRNPRRLDRQDHARPRERDAEPPPASGGGARAQGRNEDHLPGCCLHLSCDLRHRARPAAHLHLQHRLLIAMPEQAAS